MARGKESKIEPAVTTFNYLGSVSALNGKYISIAQSLSNVNRRMYEQGKIYFLESVKITMSAPAGFLAAANSQVGLGLAVIHDTWVTRNAWVKAKAEWKSMNLKVLKDNPSVQGKWANFKVFMDEAHYNGGSGNTGPTLNLLPVNSTPLPLGEWAMSEFVRPQHEVNAATGLPLAADLFYGHMLGADVGSLAPGSALNSGAIIQAFEDTRAQVRQSPLVPAEMSTSWMTLLTDDGSQEPELADIIEAESDEAPYDMTDYIGGNASWSVPSIAFTSVTSMFAPEDIGLGFAVPLGLLKISTSEVTATDGENPYALQNPTMLIQLNIAKGHYKGVACTEVRQ